VVRSTATHSHQPAAEAVVAESRGLLLMAPEKSLRGTTAELLTQKR
jgi:hypothetical protein